VIVGNVVTETSFLLCIYRYNGGVGDDDGYGVSGGYV
jgi:hypothetical protein